MCGCSGFYGNCFFFETVTHWWNTPLYCAPHFFASIQISLIWGPLLRDHVIALFYLKSHNPDRIQFVTLKKKGITSHTHCKNTSSSLLHIQQLKSGVATRVGNNGQIWTWHIQSGVGNIMVTYNQNSTRLTITTSAYVIIFAWQIATFYSLLQ